MVKKKLKGGYFYTRDDLQDVIKDEYGNVIGIMNKDPEELDSKCIEDQISRDCILPEDAYFINGNVYDISPLYKSVYENDLMNYIDNSQFHKLFIGVLYHKRQYEKQLQILNHLYTSIYEEWYNFKSYAIKYLLQSIDESIAVLNNLFLNRFFIFDDQNTVKNILQNIKLELQNFYRFALFKMLEEVLVQESNFDLNNINNLVDIELFHKIKYLFKKIPIIDSDYQFDRDKFITKTVNDSKHFDIYSDSLKYFSKSFGRACFKYLFDIQVQDILHFEGNKLHKINYTDKEKYINIVIYIAKYYIFRVFIYKLIKKSKKLGLPQHFDVLLMKNIPKIFEDKIFKYLDNISKLDHQIINITQSRTSKTTQTMRTSKTLSSNTRKIQSKSNKSV